MKNQKLTYGISFPDPTVLDDARARAAVIGISFSAYVNQLLRRDLGRANMLTPAPQLDAVEEPLARYGAKAEARRKRTAAAQAARAAKKRPPAT